MNKIKCYECNKIIKKVFMYIGGVVRAFVLAVKDVVWAIAGIVLLNMLLLNYLAENYPITVSDSFLKVTMILSQNAIWFFYIIWIYYIIFEFKDLKEKKEDDSK